VEACAQGLVGHAFTRHPFQAAVLVASSGAVDAVHLLERAGRKQDDREALEPGAKIRSGKLVGFDGQNDLVHTTAFLLANAHPAHEVGEAFVAGLVAVDETVHGHDRFAGVGDFDPVGVNLNHHGCATDPKVLVDEGVGDEFADNDFRDKFYLFAEGILNHFVLRKLGRDEAHEPLKADGVAFRPGLVELGLQLRAAGVNDDAGGFAGDVRKILKFLRQQQRTKAADGKTSSNQIH